MVKIGACEIMITAPSLRRIAAAQPRYLTLPGMTPK
jgi:hypothetical protein